MFYTKLLFYEASHKFLNVPHEINIKSVLKTNISDKMCLSRLTVELAVNMVFGKHGDMISYSKIIFSGKKFIFI